MSVSLVAHRLQWRRWYRLRTLSPSMRIFATFKSNLHTMDRVHDVRIVSFNDLGEFVSYSLLSDT